MSADRPGDLPGQTDLVGTVTALDVHVDPPGTGQALVMRSSSEKGDTSDGTGAGGFAVRGLGLHARTAEISSHGCVAGLNAKL